MNISADYIFDGEQLLRDHMIIRDERHRIEAVLPISEAGETSRQHYRGYLFPGWINTHCHLELSHMYGMLPTGTGLVDFIKGIVQQREEEVDAIYAAGEAADLAMYEAGIDAVGDISNTDHSFGTKKDSSIRYHTFIEVFDLMKADQAASHMLHARSLLDQAPQSATIVPHAPYSCSPDLLHMLRDEASAGPISIHNQETQAEHEFFMSGSGKLIDFYRDLGVDVAHFKPTGTPSLAYYLDHQRHTQQQLYVHNTMATMVEVARAIQSTDAYWVTCPSANLYIESSLPNYRALVEQGARMCIGTDSLASNWSLDIWEEMKTIKRYHSYLSVQDILRWGSANGADALAMTDLGRLRPGATSSLLHLESDAPLEQIFDQPQRPVRI